MVDEKAAGSMSRSPFTWVATLEIAPLSYIGSQEKCLEWTNLLLGQRVIIVDKDGHSHDVGVVTCANHKPYV